MIVNSGLLCVLTAGRATTNDELENMLESGNPAIFTQGVSEHLLRYFNATLSELVVVIFFIIVCRKEGTAVVNSMWQSSLFQGQLSLLSLQGK